MNTIKIGWIGLGKMGVPMVQNLLKVGYNVSVFNRSKQVLELFKNQDVGIANHPKELIDTCDVVILMVADDKATEVVFSGENGLLSSSATNKIVINMSTVSAGISQKMTAVLVKNGNEYLDAPVSGSLKQATEGSLVIMVGGKEHVFEQVKPIFSHLGKLALRVGDVGVGNSAKLAINALLSFHALGLAEAVVFAKDKGIETSTLLELINNSALANPFMKIKGEAILQQNYDAVFALKHIVKDLTLAKDAGIDSPLANTALKSFAEAQNKLGEEDIISIIKTL